MEVTLIHSLVRVMLAARDFSGRFLVNAAEGQSEVLGGFILAASLVREDCGLVFFTVGTLNRFAYLGG